MQFFITWLRGQHRVWTYSLRSLPYFRGYLPLLYLQTRRVLLLMERAKKDSSPLGFEYSGRKLLGKGRPQESRFYRDQESFFYPYSLFRKVYF